MDLPQALLESWVQVVEGRNADPWIEFSIIHEGNNTFNLYPNHKCCTKPKVKARV